MYLNITVLRRSGKTRVHFEIYAIREKCWNDLSSLPKCECWAPYVGTNQSFRNEFTVIVDYRRCRTLYMSQEWIAIVSTFISNYELAHSNVWRETFPLCLFSRSLIMSHALYRPYTLCLYNYHNLLVYM